MNGIDNIIKKILTDADREAEQILSRAKLEAEEIARGFDREAELRRAEILDKGQKEAAERVKRLSGVSELETRKLQLAAKQEMLALAFDSALHRLRGMPEKEQLSFLVRLGLGMARGGEKLILSPSDREAFGDKLVSELNQKLSEQGRSGAVTLSEETRDIRGGMILVDGRAEINASYEALVRSARDELAPQTAEILF